MDGDHNQLCDLDLFGSHPPCSHGYNWSHNLQVWIPRFAPLPWPCSARHHNLVLGLLHDAIHEGTRGQLPTERRCPSSEGTRQSKGLIKKTTTDIMNDVEPDFEDDNYQS